MVLLRTSADFMASDYCWDKEMTRALERHRAGEAVVVPVILRPCDWSSAPFAKLQGFPKDAKAVTTWTNRDEAWLDVVKALRHTIEDLQARRAQAPGHDPSPR